MQTHVIEFLVFIILLVKLVSQNSALIKSLVREFQWVHFNHVVRSTNHLADK